VRENRDDLAKQALLRAQEHANHAQELQTQWERHREDTERLKDSLRQLNAKIEEAKRKKNLLIAKQKRAQAQRRIHETITGLQDRSAFRAFDQMADKIETEERRAIAAAEVTEELEGDDLARELDLLAAATPDVEDRLLELKRDMGLLPPAPDDVEDAELKVLEGGAEVQDAEIVEEESG
jgi:phage shock protein A